MSLSIESLPERVTSEVTARPPHLTLVESLGHEAVAAADEEQPAAEAAPNDGYYIDGLDGLKYLVRGSSVVCRDTWKMPPFDR